MSAHEGPELDAAGPYTIIDCQECQFAHAVPLPTPEALRAYYTEAYYQQDKRDYLRHAEEDRGWWELVYAERLQMLERWLAIDRRMLLDVGSGPGLFLHVARERGWDNAEGVEPSPVAAQYAAERFGLTIHNEEFTKRFVDGYPSSVDAIHMGEVLEHVASPFETLRNAYDMLSTNGMLCVVVPNEYSVLQSAVEQQGLGRHWIQPPAHLNYFNPRSLANLLNRCGFATADISCTFPMELFVLMGLNYIGDDEMGRRVHGMRKRMEIAMEQSGLGDARRELYRAFAKRGIGRDIVMVARRSG